MEKKRTKFEDQVIRRRKRKFFLGAAVLAVFLGLCYLFVWERVYTLRLAEENAKTRQRVHYLKERSQSLEFEINQLSSVKRIEDIARHDLALLPAREVQLAGFTMSSRGGISTDPGSAKPKTREKPQASAKPQKADELSKIDKQQKTARPKANGKAATPKPKARK
ncbi:MAG: septum formation initiator family protein [candidate division Zixibacteria bacterium]|nr:septum formation initiator family protein [candidate division Zixibacteria bacterium]